MKRKKHKTIIKPEPKKWYEKENFIHNAKLGLFVFTVSYIVLILFLSTIPGNILEDTPIPKYAMLLHFLEFFVLAALVLISAITYECKRPISVTALIIIILAVFTEMIQRYVPGRFLVQLMFLLISVEDLVFLL